MKYTDRKKTPLKWHHFLTYIGMPLTILTAGFNLLGLISELFGLQISHTRILLKPVLAAYGATVGNLGGCFWYVVVYFLVQVLLFILLLYTWFGMFSWKEEARKGWILYLLAVTILNGVIGFGAFQIYRKSSEQFSSLVASLQKYNGISQLTIGNGIVLGMLLLFLIVSFIYFLLNAIYYGKRKALFVDTYLQPENGGMIYSAETAPAAAPEPVAEQPAAPVEPSVEETVPETSSAPLTETAPVEDTVPTPEPVLSEPVKEEPAAEEPQQEEIVRFCPNCGAKLTENDQMFCTHCGTKLK